MTRLERWGDSDDPEQSGLIIGGLEISTAELGDLPADRAAALDAGVTNDLLDEYEDQGGTYGPGDLLAWLESRT
jgi:hypothetical protein